MKIILALSFLLALNLFAAEQKLCPIMVEDEIDAEEVVDYKGKKIYFFKSRDIERRWEKDPEGYFKKARAKGLLPQFDEKE